MTTTTTAVTSDAHFSTTNCGRVADLQFNRTKVAAACIVAVH